MKDDSWPILRLRLTPEEVAELKQYLAPSSALSKLQRGLHQTMISCASSGDGLVVAIRVAAPDDEKFAAVEFNEFFGVKETDR